MTSAATRWRRGLFEPGIAHLPDPDRPATYRTRSGRRWQRAWCDRFVQPDRPAEIGDLRCPDCARLDAEQTGDDESAGGGGPGAAAR